MMTKRITGTTEICVFVNFFVFKYAQGFCHNEITFLNAVCLLFITFFNLSTFFTRCNGGMLVPCTVLYYL